MIPAHQSWQAPAHSPPPLWPLWSSSVFSDYTNRFSACLVPSKGRRSRSAHLRGWISRRTFWRLARWWARCTDWFCGLPSDFQSSVGARNRRCTLRSRGWSIWHARYEQQSRPRVLSRAPQRLVGGGEAAQPIFFRGEEIFVRDFLEDIATGNGRWQSVLFWWSAWHLCRWHLPLGPGWVSAPVTFSAGLWGTWRCVN